MNLNIKEGAIFVADSHFNQKNIEFLQFLNKLEKEEIKTSQLFLMGDIIDFISSECKYFIKQNHEIIDILNNLSKKIEIIYLEGNHDYNLQELFSNIKITFNSKSIIFESVQLLNAKSLLQILFYLNEEQV